MTIAQGASIIWPVIDKVLSDADTPALPAAGRLVPGGAEEQKMSAVMPTYARVNLAFERGEGAHLFTADGTRYLDFAGGVAVSSLGHGHPHLVAALTDQARTLWHTSNLYRIPGQEQLAERLCANSFADLVFFCNSGAEAMEGAIKTARRFQFHEGRPDRYRVITFTGAFHGRTLATIAAGDNAKEIGRAHV